MSAAAKSLAVVVLVTSLVAMTAALECYECGTGKQGSCGDGQFNRDQTDTCSGKLCSKVVTKQKTYRRCVTDVMGQKEGCTGDENVGDGRVCYCSSDQCNTAAVHSVTSTHLMITVVTILTLFTTVARHCFNGY